MPQAELLLRNATHIATMDDARTEIPGGWVAVTDGFISGIGKTGEEPPATKVLDATDCLLTPGLINTHHHLYQNLTRAFAPALSGGLFFWLQTLYPKWSRMDAEGAYISAWVGLLELALGGCTTSTDHLYIHPKGAGDLLEAEISAARELGFRFHPTRGSMSLSQKDGGLPPDSVVETTERILEESERAVKKFHDPRAGSMLQIALAPCSPFSVTTQLMTETAQLAEQLDVRLHTHLAETLDENSYCLSAHEMRPLELFDSLGWGNSRSWVAHCVHPSAGEITRLGEWGTGVAHCPSSNMILASGLAPVWEMRKAGVPVGLGCDGSASADSGSLWTEARTAYLQGRLRAGLGGKSANERAPMGAREALEIATRGGAACLGRTGELGELATGAVGDIVAWKLDGVSFAGALSDPVEAWLRCGPTKAHHTVIAGSPLVESGELQVARIEDKLGQHRKVAEKMQEE